VRQGNKPAERTISDGPYKAGVLATRAAAVQSEIVALARKRLHKTMFARTIFELLLHGDIEKLLWRAFGLALGLHLIWQVVREMMHLSH
jgi:hypothetical protein